MARHLAAGVGVGEAGAPGTGLTDGQRRFADLVSQDLQAHRGASLVIAGDGQPPVVHALAHAMNETLDNVGRTVVYTDPVEASPLDQAQALTDLINEMNAGQVDVLLIIGGNPVYTAPADLRFADALAKVPLGVHLGSHEDETSALCHWHIPQAHFLEAWSDGRAFDGTVSIQQPLIAPLYGGRTAHDLIATMSATPEKSAYDQLREYWSAQAPAGEIRGPGAAGAPGGAAQAAAAAAEPPPAAEQTDAGAADATPSPEFEGAWRRWLHDGVVPNTAFAPRDLKVRRQSLQGTEGSRRPQGERDQEGSLEIAFRLDPTVLDGRFANNGWLQELPKPITKLAWDNAVIVSPATAERLAIVQRPAMQGGEHGQVVTDIVELRYRGRAVRGPAFAVPGHPDDCVTVHLGYGRTRAGRLGTGAGFSANSIRTIDALHFGRGVEVTKTGGRFSLACTQYHHLMDGRDLVRAVTRDAFVRDPDAVHEGHHSFPLALTLHPPYRYEGYKWGMAIDINACIGCNACIVACQAENNIAVVGKDQVLRGREMHWLRVDAYYRGDAHNPETYFQPVPCMHCENAPCEVVCPVNATVHSHEGLNDMVYNRCVGTRYCSNNCPYKVRRFNYHLYQDWETPSLKLGRNPDVTVRSRGVMEKCTYCVQRINAAKIEAEKEHRAVRDGEIQTACAQTCPAEAIVFGNLNDPQSRVAELQAAQRNYSLLGDLNTRPRTTYLAAVRNANPALGPSVPEEAAGGH
jgi:molybdopterin-containing oxidoreductase family iron-sulfur binding subunit